MEKDAARGAGRQGGSWRPEELGLKRGPSWRRGNDSSQFQAGASPRNTTSGGGAGKHRGSFCASASTASGTSFRRPCRHTILLTPGTRRIPRRRHESRQAPPTFANRLTHARRKVARLVTPPGPARSDWIPHCEYECEFPVRGEEEHLFSHGLRRMYGGNSPWLKTGCFRLKYLDFFDREEDSDCQVIRKI